MEEGEGSNDLGGPLRILAATEWVGRTRDSRDVVLQLRRSRGVSGHPSNTSVSEAPASQVVNIAFPAQVLAVHRGYIIAAIPVSSVALAAAVVTGTGVTVGTTVIAGSRSARR